MILFTVYIASFLSADYLITGSVTSTWIGMALLTGAVATVARRAIVAVASE